MLPTKKELYRAIMKFEHIVEPKNGSKITVDKSGKLNIPDNPIIPFIEGDGIGSDITPAMIKVIDNAVETAYGDEIKISWMPALVIGSLTGGYLGALISLRKGSEFIKTCLERCNYPSSHRICSTVE